MKWQELLSGIFARVSRELEKSLEGLTAEDLSMQPSRDSNSIGWIAWHLTRAQDRVISDFSGEEQLWLKDRWHEKFNRSPDAADTGYGHSPEDVAGFKSPGVKTLVDYHHAVLERTKGYLDNLSEVELAREVDHPRYPTVGAHLTAVINDNLQHVGQVAYLHGLLKGRGWLD